MRLMFKRIRMFLMSVILLLSIMINSAIFDSFAVVAASAPTQYNSFAEKWEQYLRDFLLKFPSLFNDAINSDSYINGSGVYPEDAVDRYIPFMYELYDLDNDEIPEVAIYFGIPGSDTIYFNVYKLYDDTYTLIGDFWISSGDITRFYINSKKQIVIEQTNQGSLSSIFFAEIKNQKIVISVFVK